MTDPSALKSELQDLWARYQAAYRAGDATGCAGVFALDALLISPYAPPARGRDAIAQTHRDWVAEPGAIRKTLGLVDFGGAGTDAWCLIRFSEDGETGLALAVLARGPDGGWLVRLCSLNDGDI